MIYVLVTKTLIKQINTKRDYLKIFAIGSVAYVIIHYYLSKNKLSSYVDKIATYLPALMIADFAAAIYLVKNNLPDQPDEQVDEQKDLIKESYQPIEKPWLQKEPSMEQKYPSMEQKEPVKEEAKETSEMTKSKEKSSKTKTDTEIPIYKKE